MWFFMYACYLFSIISFLMLTTVFAQSLHPFYVFQASPMSFLILTSIIYLFTETLIMFFFVGTGVSIKEYTLEKNLEHTFHRQSISIKRKIYPPQLFNIIILMTAFVLFGAADTQKIPHWIYPLSLFCGIIHFMYAKRIQHESFKKNTQIILDMVGIKRQL